MSDTAIKIENLKKQYRLGTIGGRTLNAELQSWWARKRGQEDPNLKIGEGYNNYGETFWALKGIDLEVKKGEALGIIGANGAGKSTLLKILSRVTAPTEGDIWINGRIASMLEVGTGFHKELTGRENIYMNGAILGMTKKEVDSKIESIIDFSECREFIDTPVKRYSSGMYVKLAFAVASHLDAEIMVMDEVLAVGDMKFQKKCLGKMGDEAKGGRTVLYVSHNMATIRSLCTRCIVLDKGEIVYNGNSEDAINVYLNSDDTQLETMCDLKNEPRENHSFGKDFHFDSIDFLSKDLPIYNVNEKVVIRVKYSTTLCHKDLRVFLHIYNGDNAIPVGLTISEDLELNKPSGIQIVELDISQLAAGLYFFEIGAMRLLPNGNHVTYDRVKKKLYFQVTRENEGKLPVWNSSVFGNMVFPEMRVR